MSRSAMTPLYKRLKAAGLKRSYVKEQLLPDWWEDSLASNRVNYLQALGSLAKHTGLPLGKMLDESAELNPNITGPAVAYKRRNNTEIADFPWATAIAISAAHHAVASLKAEYSPPITDDPEGLRAAILDRGHAWVSLEGLLELVWSMGIPVLHMSNFPGSKMEGLAIYTEDGPAIVLTSKQKKNAWLLFHLAHELGHIMLKHVSGCDFIDDESIDLNDEETQEEQANAFAIRLLTGGIDKFTAPHIPTAQELARAATTEAPGLGVDPGVIVLNYIYYAAAESEANYWGLANNALKLVAPEDNAPELVRQFMLERLDLSRLPRDSADVLVGLCGVE